MGEGLAPVCSMPSMGASGAGTVGIWEQLSQEQGCQHTGGCSRRGRLGARGWAETHPCVHPSFVVHGSFQNAWIRALDP